MTKYKVKFVDNDIIITCAKCQTQHQLVFNMPGKYNLNNEPFSKEPMEDLFELDDVTLSPNWICRNQKCTNWATVKVKCPKP